jgi:predicted molibdopterin-dependent oxidoreductase YjgC
MFRRLPEDGAAARQLVVMIDGETVRARDGDTVAAALLIAGCIDFRTTPVIGSKRGPFCMMGACFDCLVTIDGLPNQQACALRVRDGMKIERQHGARSLPGVE